MAKRRSDEERVHEFFSEAPLATIQPVFNIIKGVVKNRALKEAPDSPPAPKRKVVRRKSKTALEPVEPKLI